MLNNYLLILYQVLFCYKFSVAALLAVSLRPIGATLLVVLNIMDGERWCTPTKQLETLLPVCEAVRRMPEEFINSRAATP